MLQEREIRRVMDLKWISCDENYYCDIDFRINVETEMNIKPFGGWAINAFFLVDYLNGGVDEIARKKQQQEHVQYI